MHQTGILYESLPMIRLGARDEDEEVIVAADFSTSAYMLEEYLTLAAASIAVPASLPEAKKLSEFPLLLRKRIKIIDDSSERLAVSRILHSVRTELGIKESEEGNRLLFPKEMPQQLKHQIKVIHSSLFRVSAGFNHSLQVSISPGTIQSLIRDTRKHLANDIGRVVLAQLEGLFSVYEDVTFDVPQPPVTAPPELITLFDKLLNDPYYLQLSEAMFELGSHEKRSAALSKVRDWGRKLMTKSLLTKGWNYAGKAVKAWRGTPIPEADTLLSLISGKEFPVLVDLRKTRKRAVAAWHRSLNSTQPLSSTGDGYKGVSWFLPGAPPEDWDGGELSVYSFGRVSDLKSALEQFAQQNASVDGDKPRD